MNCQTITLGKGFYHVKHMTNVKSLTVGECSHIDYGELNIMINLKELSIHNASVRPFSFKYLESIALETLRVVSIGRDEESINAIQTLQALELHFCHILFDLRLERLTNLHVDSCEIGDGLNHFKYLYGLTVLSVVDCELSRLDGIEQLNNLFMLRLDSNQLKNINTLNAMNNLVLVELEDNPIHYELKLCKTLEKLNELGIGLDLLNKIKCEKTIELSDEIVLNSTRNVKRVNTTSY